MSETQLPGIGTGILQPKQQNKWRLIILDSQGKRTSYTNALAMQALLLGGISTYGDGRPGCSVYIEFRDDIENAVHNGIQVLLKEKDFIIDVQDLNDNDEVIRTTRLEGCKVSLVTDTGRDYGSSADVVISVNVEYMSHSYK